MSRDASRGALGAGRLTALAIVVAALACSNITEGSGGVVAIELRTPNPAIIEVGDTFALQARALNRQGDSVAAPIFWRTPDTAGITIVDSAAGTVTAKLDTGTARVQARNGTLLSDLVPYALGPHSDTLVVPGPDTTLVPTGVDTAGPLIAQLRTLAVPAGVAGGTLIYEIVSPAFPTGTIPTVTIGNGLLRVLALTDTSGAPITPVILRAVPGQPKPATVIVEVRWTRPSGTPVPGSPHDFVINFTP
ncbi:MAG: hypothetical protein ABJD11_12690 [Gemmatimonadota bacterium]